MKRVHRNAGIYVYFTLLGCASIAVGIVIGVGIFDDGAASCQIEKSLCNRGLVLAGLMTPVLAASFEGWHRGLKIRERRKRPKRLVRKEPALRHADQTSIVPEHSRGGTEQAEMSPLPRRELKSPSLW